MGYSDAMKTQLRAVPHTEIPGATVFEVWFNGEFVATVCGGDGPSVRVISKHWLEAFPRNARHDDSLNVTTVMIERK